MSNPLAKFVATVEFKALTEDLYRVLAKIKRELNETRARGGGTGGSSSRSQQRTTQRSDELEWNRQVRLRTAEARQRRIEANRQAREERNRQQQLINSHLLQMRHIRRLREAERAAHEENRRRQERADRQRRTSANNAERELRRQRRETEAEWNRQMREGDRQHRLRNRPPPSGGGGSSGGRSLTDVGMSVQGALTGVAAASGAKQFFDVANFTQGRMPQFEFITGSAEKAKEQVAFVDKEVERLSLNLVGANNQYRQLLASGGDALGIEQTQKLFSSFSEIATLLNLSADAQKRALNSFGQMASKGTVMSEELNFRLAA